MADEKEKGKLLQTVDDDESLAWDICEDYIATDRAIFGKDSPHSFGVRPLYTMPGQRSYAIYVKENSEKNEEEDDD